MGTIHRDIAFTFKNMTQDERANCEQWYSHLDEYDTRNVAVFLQGVRTIFDKEKYHTPGNALEIVAFGSSVHTPSYRDINLGFLAHPTLDLPNLGTLEDLTQDVFSTRSMGRDDDILFFDRMDFTPQGPGKTIMCVLVPTKMKPVFLEEHEHIVSVYKPLPFKYH